MAAALEAGALSWCAARELTRIAVPDTEQAWLDAARGKTQRELEALVARTAPGDAPDTGGHEPPRTRVLRFEVAPDTFATFREAVQRLRREAGRHLDDDAILLEMARHVLGGPQDEGRSSYQISLHVCSLCGGGAQAAGGELVTVDADVVSMAACDAQQPGEVLPQGTAHRAANENADRCSHPGTDDGPASTTARPCSKHAHMGANSACENDIARAAAAPLPRAGLAHETRVGTNSPAAFGSRHTSCCHLRPDGTPPQPLTHVHGALPDLSRIGRHTLAAHALPSGRAAGAHVRGPLQVAWSVRA